MTRNIWKIKIFGADELNRGPFEHSVMLFANITSVFDGFFEYVMDALVIINQHVHKQKTE